MTEQHREPGDSYFGGIAAAPETQGEYRRARLELEVTERICVLMEKGHVSRAELARRLGRPRGYVTRVLRDGSGLTLAGLSDIFHALGRSAAVVDRPACAPARRVEQPSLPAPQGTP